MKTRIINSVGLALSLMLPLPGCPGMAADSPVRVWSSLTLNVSPPDQRGSHISGILTMKQNRRGAYMAYRRGRSLTDSDSRSLVRMGMMMNLLNAPLWQWDLAVGARVREETAGIEMGMHFDTFHFAPLGLHVHMHWGRLNQILFQDIQPSLGMQCGLMEIRAGYRIFRTAGEAQEGPFLGGTVWM